MKKILTQVFIKQLSIRIFIYFLCFFWYYIFLVYLFHGEILWKEFWIGYIFLLFYIFIIYVFFTLIQKIINFRNKWTQFGIKIFCIIFLFLPLSIIFFQIHRIKIWTPSNPLIYSHYKTLHYTTKDNIQLEWWYLLHHNSTRSIIFWHGVGSNKWDFLEYAKIWYNLWFNVAIFDFRWHWNSWWHTISFGYYESQDIKTITENIKKDFPERTKNIYWVGYSMWWAAMIFAQAQYHLFDKLIIDSSYASSEHMIDYLYRYIPSWYREYLKIIWDWYSQNDISISITSINPQDIISQIDIPILFFHGKQDSMIPYSETELLFQHATNPKNKIYLFDNSDHVSAIIEDYNTYVERVTDFLK